MSKNTPNHYKRIIEEILQQLSIRAGVSTCRSEGAFLICDLSLESGGKVRQVESHSMEIALALRSKTEPLIYPVPSEGIVRMEFLMFKQDSVSFAEVVEHSEFHKAERRLPLALGRTRNGDVLVADLATMPHLLVAGATGSGKSVTLHTIINSLLSSGVEVRFAFIDPKRVELSCYSEMGALYAPIAQDPEEAIALLRNLTDEMDRRFELLKRAGCRSISDYRRRMPYIAVVVDEMAELMMTARREAQDLICRLAQKSRACGIHLVVATQRPSADVVTGLIKANFPARLSCRVSSGVDSRVVLDRTGAERLAGSGDSILDCAEHPFVRFKGSFVTRQDIAGNAYTARPSWWRKLWDPTS